MTSTPLGGAVNNPEKNELEQWQIEALEQEQSGMAAPYDPANYTTEESTAPTDDVEEKPEEDKPEEEERPNIATTAAGAIKGAAEYITGGEYGKDVAEQFTPEGAKEFAFKAAGAGISMLDFGLDVVGNAPGGESIDDWYDEATKFKRNPNLQKAREVMSVIVPTAVAGLTLGPAVGSLAGQATKGSAIAKGVATLGVDLAADVAVTYNSDLSERDETLATGIGEWLDSMGNPLGMSIPDAMRTMDDDSPAVRTQKNTLESAGLSILGSALGYVLKGAMRPPMQWFKPMDETAAKYKNSEIKVNMDPETVDELARLDNLTTDITTRQTMIGPSVRRLQEEGALIPADIAKIRTQMDMLSSTRKQADNKKVQLINEYIETGKSSATRDPLEAYVQQEANSRLWQIDDAAAAKIDAGLTDEFDSDIMSELVPESGTARQSIPKGNVARNKADITALETGTSKGSPAPIISEPMLRKGFTEDTREVIEDLAANDTMAGNFKAVIDGVEFDKTRMDEASMDLYRKIMDSRDPDEINELLLTRLDLEELSRLSVGSRQASRALEEDAQTRAMAFAMRDLTEKYLSQEVNLQSARAMRTVAAEVSDIAKAGSLWDGVANPERIDNLVLDKIQFLMQEYGISKYVWGWSGNNKKWWKKFENASPEQQAKIATDISAQMEAGVRDRKIRAQNYRDMFQKFKEDGDLPTARAVTKAYELTNGEVDSVIKLNAWINKQMNPMGMLYSTDKDLNMFADGAKSVVYNWVLSGKAALNAFKGNISSTIMQPIAGMVGAGWEAMAMQSMEPVKRGFYAYSGLWTTQQRAFTTAIDVFKSAADDPVKYMDRLRTDYKFGDPDRWEILDDAAQKFETDGDIGKQIMYSWMKLNQGLSLHAIPRFGINAMLGIDAATSINQATIASRFRAWDEVFTRYGDANPALLDQAEDIHYAQVFDKDNVIKDDYVKYTTSEIALNADDDVASALTALTNKLPALTPFIMFPKTGVNAIKQALSYTPLTKTGFGRYGRIMTADTDEAIADALAAVGITNFYEDPAMGRLMHRNLKNEYTGRMIMGMTITMGAMNYALAGNIRGHGPYNPSEMRKIRQSFPEWQPKTIKVLGKWISYEGMPLLDPMLALVGDLAYNASDVGTFVLEDITRKLGFSFMQAFGDKAGMRGIEPLFSIAKGDETALNRFFAQEARKVIPMSGTLGVLANLDDTHKDIYNDFKGYVMNRLPGLKSMLPNHIDPWTGNPIRDVDSPMLRMINAISPVQVSEPMEPWRKWLFKSGWQGMSMLRKDPDGVMEYTPAMREQIMKTMGKDQLWVHIAGGTLPDGKVIRPESALMYNKDFNEQIEEMRAFRSQVRDQGEIELKEQNLPVYQYLNTIIRESQGRAQQIFLDQNPGLDSQIRAQKTVDKKLKDGSISEAISVKETEEKEVQQLLNFK